MMVTGIDDGHRSAKVTRLEPFSNVTLKKFEADPESISFFNKFTILINIKNKRLLLL